MRCEPWRVVRVVEIQHVPLWEAMPPCCVEQRLVVGVSLNHIDVRRRMDLQTYQNPFTWHKMKTMVNEFVSHCPICQQAKFVSYCSIYQQSQVRFFYGHEPKYFGIDGIEACAHPDLKTWLT